ncbi:MAG TPA: lipopolysaccharide biosynthesis protein [Micromonosporaceae bacterium]
MRARFWLRVGTGVAAGVAVGVAVIVLTPAAYRSSTSVLVESVGTEVNMGTEAELVRSTGTATDAAARLTGDPAHPQALGRLVSVRPVPGTSVMVLTYEAPTAQTARDGATAYAEAYLAGRRETAKTAINDQIDAAQRQLDDVRTQLGQVEALLAATPTNSPEAGSLWATQASLTTQSVSLAAQLTALQATTVDPGRVVAQANLPSAPVRPNRPLWLGIAAAAGAGGGGVLHLSRTRWSRRVRDAADLRRHQITVLADLEPAALVTPGGHQDPNGRAFNRLRNEVVAALAPEDHTLLVTGAAPGTASTLVAANLAAALARADNDVALVGASVPDLDSTEQAVTLAGIFDLADIPGLTDVLAGRTTLARTVQRAPRSPRLKVITPGGTASAAGLLQSEGARSVLRLLATRTRYVIVDAPSTSAGADAQSLASVADVAVLVVEAEHAQHAQVADAATQLSRVGTRLLGAVLVPARVPTSPYGSMSTSERVVRAIPATAPGHDTPGWIGDRTGPLDGPTSKLEILNRPTRARVPLDDPVPDDPVEEPAPPTAGTASP